MEVEIIMLSEIKQTQKDKHHPLFFSYVVSRQKEQIKVEVGVLGRRNASMRREKLTGDRHGIVH